MPVLEVWDNRGQTYFQLDGETVLVGRADGCQLRLPDDDHVSKRHALLERIAGVWLIHDLGSTNGTFVNGAMLVGEHALHDDDTVNLGKIRLVYRDSGAAKGTSTAPLAPVPKLTPAQHRTLVELVRPILRPEKAVPAPATRKDIAARLYVGEGAVQANLTALYDKFGIEETGQRDRRYLLANEAIQRGAVKLRDLDETGG